MQESLFARHKTLLDKAVEAIHTRGYWTPFSEMPSPKAYGDTANDDGKKAFEEPLNKPFPLDQPGTVGQTGSEHCGWRQVGKMEPALFEKGSLRHFIGHERCDPEIRGNLRCTSAFSMLCGSELFFALSAEAGRKRCEDEKNCDWNEIGLPRKVGNRCRGKHESRGDR